MAIPTWQGANVAIPGLAALIQKQQNPYQLMGDTLTDLINQRQEQEQAAQKAARDELLLESQLATAGLNRQEAQQRIAQAEQMNPLKLAQERIQAQYAQPKAESALYGSQLVNRSREQGIEGSEYDLGEQRKNAQFEENFPSYLERYMEYIQSEGGSIEGAVQQMNAENLSAEQMNRFPGVKEYLAEKALLEAGRTEEEKAASKEKGNIRGKMEAAGIVGGGSPAIRDRIRERVFNDNFFRTNEGPVPNEFRREPKNYTDTMRWMGTNRDMARIAGLQPRDGAWWKVFSTNAGAKGAATTEDDWKAMEKTDRGDLVKAVHTLAEEIGDLPTAIRAIEGRFKPEELDKMKPYELARVVRNLAAGWVGTEAEAMGAGRFY